MALRARIAITAVFALNGALFASLFSRLPAIQDRTELSDGALGLALLCSMLGLMLSQLITGALVARFGSRPLVLVGALGYAVGLVPAGLSESFAALAGSLAFIGFANGVLDVSMNVHGLTVERALGHPILSTLHAAFSFGALAGAGVGALAASADVGVVAHLTSVTAAGIAIALAATGLAAFSLTMGIGRLAGDRLNVLFGPVRLARGGATLSLVGIAVALSASGAEVAVPGFAAMGLGLAALFPLALRAAALRGDTPGPSVAAVSALGYLGC